MFQAIVTKFHGPTDIRGSQVLASAQAGRITLSWDHALNSDRNHVAAAQALAEKYGWREYWLWWNYNVPDGWDVVDVDDDPGFSWNCRCHGLPWSGGELVEYTIIQVGV